MAKTVLTSWMGKIRTWRSDVWDFLNNIEIHTQANHADLVDWLSSLSAAIWFLVSTDSKTYNIRIAVIDKEHSQRLPDGTKAFDLKTTDGTAIRWTFEAGRVAKAKRPYNTLATNESYSKDKLNFVGETIYFACSTETPMVELICWI